MLKCFSRLGYFPALSEVPALGMDDVRRDLDLPLEVAAVYAAGRTSRRHRDAIRQRVGVMRDPDAARRWPWRSGKPRTYGTIPRI